MKVLSKTSYANEKDFNKLQTEITIMRKVKSK